MSARHWSPVSRGSSCVPAPSDLRYQWVAARLPALDVAEQRELLTDAWAMCVPKSVRETYFAKRPREQVTASDQLDDAR